MEEKSQKILDLLRNEVQPALGCTGPVVFAYVAAEARDAVGGTPKKITIRADKDKSSKEDDVQTPGTLVPGVRMAAALGAFAGDPKAKMKVLHTVTPELERKAFELCQSGNVLLYPDWDIPIIGIYIEVTVETENGVGRAVVVKNHTNLVHKSANGRAVIDIPFDRIQSIAEEESDFVSSCSISDFYEFVENVPVGQISFLKEAIQMNETLAASALEGKIGPTFADSILKRSQGSAKARAVALTSAGAEARMAGVSLPAMACATSGNVGITASLPVISLARDEKKSEEELLRALALSFLLTILGKNKIGRQSAMCACMVTASVAVAGAAAYLLGGALKEIEMAIQNTIINVFGVVCDGPRRACALKLASGVGIALEGAHLALDGIVTNPGEGVAGETADESIRLMGRHARSGMLESDLSLCRLLFDKQNKPCQE